MGGRYQHQLVLLLPVISGQFGCLEISSNQFIRLLYQFLEVYFIKTNYTFALWISSEKLKPQERSKYNTTGCVWWPFRLLRVGSVWRRWLILSLFCCRGFTVVVVCHSRGGKWQQRKLCRATDVKMDVSRFRSHTLWQCHRLDGTRPSPLIFLVAWFQGVIKNH